MAFKETIMPEALAIAWQIFLENKEQITLGALILAIIVLNKNIGRIKGEVSNIDKSVDEIKNATKKFEDTASVQINAINSAVGALSSQVQSLNSSVSLQIKNLSTIVDQVKSGVETNAEQIAANSEQLEGIQAETTGYNNDASPEAAGVGPFKVMREDWTSVRNELVGRGAGHSDGRTKAKYGRIGRAYVTLTRSMAQDGWVTPTTIPVVEKLQDLYRRTMNPRQQAAYNADIHRQQEWAAAVQAFNLEKGRWSQSST